MDNTATQKDKINFTDLLVDFIQKKKIILIIMLMVIFAMLAIAGLTITLLESAKINAIAQVDTLSQRYDEIKSLTDETKKKEAIDNLLADLKSVSNQKGLPSARALSIAASIHADQKEWAEAETTWVASAEAAPNSYLAPVSLYNAATVAEDRGDYSRALALYTRCNEEYKQDYPLAARVYFSIGRISELNNDTQGAIVAYKMIVDSWPNEGWTKLANSRIISIASQASNP